FGSLCCVLCPRRRFHLAKAATRPHQQFGPADDAHFDAAKPWVALFFGFRSPRQKIVNRSFLQRARHRCRKRIAVEKCAAPSVVRQRVETVLRSHKLSAISSGESTGSINHTLDAL